jgi:hypothetical protein
MTRLPPAAELAIVGAIDKFTLNSASSRMNQ